MKKSICFFFITFFFYNIGYTQNEYELARKYLDDRGEVYFRFKETDITKIKSLSNIISLDKKVNSYWYAYANTLEFDSFLEIGYQYSVLIPPSLSATKSDIVMATNISEMDNWDRYPSYSVYLELMQQFASEYPELCIIDTIGYSVNGRLILAAKVSKNVDEEGSNPEFFYTSSMHGDELTGFVLMLRLIDYLLKNYSKEQYIKNLIDNIQIYINPLANPDGAYRTSNDDVSGATRYNANYIDLNRNFPDPFGSALNSIQQENRIMMNYFSGHKFVLSANLHGGAQVINYPWDSFDSDTKSTADVEWWRFVSQSFVDTCRKFIQGSFSDVVSSGIIDGGDWYVVRNGRQDYINAYHHCREATMEISSEKLLASDELDIYWNLLYKSFLHYIGQASYGLTGTVTDSLTHAPLQAKVWINNHDKDSSHIYTFLPTGNYFRLIKGGTYSITYSALGYKSKTFENVVVNDFATTLLNVQLNEGQDIGIENANEIEPNCIVFPNPAKDVIHIVSHKKRILGVELFDMKSDLILKENTGKAKSVQLGIKNRITIAGNYILRIRFSGGNVITKKIIIKP